MLYRGVDIERREPTFIVGPAWRICGYDYDYGLFHAQHPRDLAIRIIRSVFRLDEIETKRFIYIPRAYRGRQSKKDTLEIYFKEK